VEITDFAGVQRTQKDFAFKELRVTATPVFAFFDLAGRPVIRYTGATRDARELMLLGQLVVEGAYRTDTFVDYKRAHEQSP
jgi:thioredoxin-related protein